MMKQKYRPGFNIFLVGGLAAMACLAVLLSACRVRPLIYEVQVRPAVITPNGDGDTDVTRIAYKLSRSADLSIYFVDEAGEKHYFRRDRRRAAGDYSVDFGGAVEGRVLPDGPYTCVLEATGDAGETQKVEAELIIKDADTAGPELRGFSVYPSKFTPNQDGLDDRVTINYYLSKEAEVKVYLIGPEDERYPLAEKEREVKPGQPGFHTYDYEGGVDMGADPPPDGTYTIRAEAQDKVGNRTVVTRTLTIVEGGVPRADIVNASVDFSPKIVPLSGTLSFTLTVENFGSVPIRTSGPPPDTLYRSDQNFNALAWYEEPGVWRVGIDYETNSSGRPYPFRFAVGGEAELTTRIINGKEYKFLLPGQRAVVSGQIQIVDAPPRNPIYFWAGLIHEEVSIDAFNDHVDPQQISIGF
jgi:hypothetical protein